MLGIKVYLKKADTKAVFGMKTAKAGYVIEGYKAHVRLRHSAETPRACHVATV